MQFVTSILDHRNSTLSQLAKTIDELPKERIGSLTLEQVCSFPQAPHGIYFMYDDDGVLWYVGKATSRTFGTRLSAHFDQNEEAMLNTVPRKIRDQGIAPDYETALMIGLDLRLSVLSVPYKAVGRLENAFRCLMRPQLNAGKKSIDGETAVQNYLTELVEG